MEEVWYNYYQLLPKFPIISSGPFLTLVDSSFTLLKLASCPGLKTPQANNGSGFANSAASAAVCPATFALAFRPIILIDGTSGEQPPDNTHPERYYRAPS